jgi:hypothetical protein
MMVGAHTPKRGGTTHPFWGVPHPHLGVSMGAYI